MPEPRRTSRTAAENREYMAAYRAANPARVKSDRRRQTARDKALRRLGKMYPHDLDILYLEELHRTFGGVVSKPLDQQTTTTEEHK